MMMLYGAKVPSYKPSILFVVDLTLIQGLGLRAADIGPKSLSLGV